VQFLPVVLSISGDMNRFVVLLLALIAFANAQAEFCDDCQFLVAYIETFVTENSTEEYVLGQIENICTLLPTEYEAQCKDGIEKEGPQIFQWMLDQEPPVKVCASLNLCPPPGRKVVKAKPQKDLKFVREALRESRKFKNIQQQLQQKVQPKAQQTKSVLDVNCNYCIYTMTLAEEFIASDSTEQSLESFLANTVCPIVQIFKDQCLALVKQLPQFISELEAYEPPEKICTQLTLCNAQKKLSVH